MPNSDIYIKPIGEIQIILHSEGKYDIETKSFGNSVDIIKVIEIPNLIVSDASVLMAARMAPGAADKVYSSEVGKNDFVQYGLTHLAIGVGSNDIVTPEVNLLKSEVFRKPFDSWAFINPYGEKSVVPTNILLFSTTFSQEEGLHSGTQPVAITEMGIFGGLDDLSSYNPTNNGVKIPVSEKNGGVMFNYKKFDVWNKPLNSSLTINWKITF
jgi:hypothetical protein